MKNNNTKNRFLTFLYRNFILFKSQFKFNLFSAIMLYAKFIVEYFKYKKLQNNNNYTIKFNNIYPCLNDKTILTPIEPTYFYQDTWLAKNIFKNKPKHHYDIGSSIKTISILSQFVPITMIDIRPIELPLKNLDFISGSILNLPFKDNSISSISSMCVIEHIGLGRYGDPFDQFGSEKAVAEIIRVTKKNGLIYVSVPIENGNTVYFNGHRAFTKDYFVSLFKKCLLEEEVYIYNTSLRYEKNDHEQHAVGMFIFKKESV